MNPTKMRRITMLLIGAGLLAPTLPWGTGAAEASDWPMWGHDPGRNMVSSETGLPISADPGKPREGTDQIDPATTKNVKWFAKIGSNVYGNPVVAGGKLYLGTNNNAPRDPKIQGDYSITLCLDANTGKFIWQLATPKLEAGRNLDPEDTGITSSPAVDGDRVYVVDNRTQALCLDINGQADGNAGPFTDEAQYIAGRGKPPVTLGPTDGDIVWKYDMRHEVGVVPHLATSSTPLVVGQHVYLNTCNGVDWTEKHTPAPDAPVLICLDKKTGKLLGQEKSGLAARTFAGNWSTPSYGVVAGKPTVIFGAGDGFCYGFDPEPDASGTLKEVWRVDCNPPEYRTKDGKPIKYRDLHGPSQVVSTPAVHDGRVYVAIGQDPDHNGDGAGCMNCIGEKDGKIDVLWRNTDIGRSMSTASVAQKLLYIADGRGFVHCLDSGTGQELWKHDAESEIWGSTLLADGKVYVGSASGELTILAAGREKKLLGKIDLGSPVHSSPVAANGVLYVATDGVLFALEAKK